MDICFNQRIPISSHLKVILRPVGKTFINGMASSYENKYNCILATYISENDFTFLIDKINDLLLNNWPCCTCFFCGYICCLPTLGCSFIFSYSIINDAQKKLCDELYRLNEEKLHSKDLHISYKSECSTSWIEIEILNSRSQSNVNNSHCNSYESDRLSNTFGLVKSQQPI